MTAASSNQRESETDADGARGRSGWRPLLRAGALIAICSGIVGLVALGVSYLIAPTFTGRASFLPPLQQQSSAAAMLQSVAGLGGVAAMAGLKTPSDQFVALMKSVTVQDALVERFKLLDLYEREFKVDARKRLSSDTKFTAGRDGLIVVEVDAPDREVAAKIANAYVEELGKLMNRLTLTEAQQRRKFFEEKLAAARSALVLAERALHEGGVGVSSLKSSPTAAVTAVAQLQAQVAAQEVRVASMRGYLSESAPDLRQAQLDLAALRAQLTKLAAANPVAMGAENAGYIDRYREFKYQETLFDLFARQYELARVDEAREGPAIQIVDVASPPEKKSRPKHLLIAVGAAVACAAAMLAFMATRGAWGARSGGQT